MRTPIAHPVWPILALLWCPGMGRLAAAELQAQSSKALGLHCPLTRDFASAAGPAAKVRGEDRTAFVEEDGVAFARLTPTGAKKEPHIAEWPAGDILSNAQGAVSCRVRFRKRADPKARAALVLALADGGGGRWTLSVKEEPYEPPNDKTAAPQGLDEADVNPADALADIEAKLGLEASQTPVATLTCQARATLFAEGDVPGGVRGRLNLLETGQWRHVVWTWRSARHTVYIDGRAVASKASVSRMQPLAEPKAAHLRLTPGMADLADLRVHRRALSSAEAELLARATPDQYLPSAPALRLWADWGLYTGRAVVYADTAALPTTALVKLACINADGKRLAEFDLRSLPSGLGEMVARVTQPRHFPEGEYHFKGIAYDQAGKELARAESAPWRARELTQPWLGSRAGLDKKHKIIPPFTPIRVDGDAVATVLRTHTIGRSGTFKSVVAAGAELLAAPVQLHVRANGRLLDFSQGPGLGEVSNAEDSAQWSAVTRTPEGHELEVHGRIEYDGVARFDVTLKPKGKLAVDKVELRLPYRPEVLGFIHSIASGFIHRFMAVEEIDGKLRAKRISWGTGMEENPSRPPEVIFDSFDLHRRPEVNRFSFVPYVHVGNYERGLSWFAESDRGWIHGSAPPMELAATPEECYLRLNVVAQPAVLTEPLSFRFFLLANPFKPLPPDWRTWSVGYRRGDKVAERSKHVWWWHWNEYAGGFRPYPGGTFDKTYEDWIGAFKKSDIIHAPFVNYGTPGGSGLFVNDGQATPYGWKTHNHRPQQDYMSYWLDRCVKEIGIKGVYIDEPYSQPYSYNVLAGDAPYIRADGTRGMGYRFGEGRAFIRRLKQVFADHGLDYSIWVHTSHWKVLPLLTFADMSMDGEWPAIWVPSFTNYHRFYFPPIAPAYLSGSQFGFVGAQMLHGNINPKEFPAKMISSRTYLAVTWPFQVLPYNTGMPDEMARVQNIRYEFGIFDEGLEDLRAHDRERWLPGSRFDSPSAYLGGTLNPARDQALLYFTARHDQRRRHTLAGGFAGLALKGKHRHAWNAETGASLNIAGKTVIDAAFPGDLTVVLVRGADQPQAPRPDGVLLGLSFDQGVDPDFSGGLTPVAGAPAADAPALVDGALELDRRSAPLGYPVVPSWAAGTVELDLRVRQFAAAPLRLVGLRHHLELDLAAARRDGKDGLLLTTAEQLEEKAPHPAFRGGKASLFMPLPKGNPEAWHHVVMTWRSGNYAVYCDGERLGQLLLPATTRLRDATALEPGLWLGDGKKGGKARASIDSVFVYDWAFSPDLTVERQGPAIRPPRADHFPVFIHGQRPESLVVGVNLGETKNGHLATRATLALRKKNAATILANGTIFTWLGTGAARLEPTGAAADTGQGVAAKPETDDVLAELAFDEEEWSLSIKLFAGSGSKAKELGERKISFKTGLDEVTGEY